MKVQGVPNDRKLLQGARAGQVDGFRFAILPRQLISRGRFRGDGEWRRRDIGLDVVVFQEQPLSPGSIGRAVRNVVSRAQRQSRPRVAPDDRTLRVHFIPSLNRALVLLHLDAVEHFSAQCPFAVSRSPDQFHDELGLKDALDTRSDVER